eukprot:gb/GECH01009444.1/.p1 GENE.gb/GECH01009444.1/~~gb/GECH01009444.1/.p1  ORF type:complete len:207 (+),score=24.10 gb/GECH01009444.1/:1-621(+)
MKIFKEMIDSCPNDDGDERLIPILEKLLVSSNVDAEMDSFFHEYDDDKKWNTLLQLFTAAWKGEYYSLYNVLLRYIQRGTADLSLDTGKCILDAYYNLKQNGYDDSSLCDIIVGCFLTKMDDQEKIGLLCRLYEMEKLEILKRYFYTRSNDFKNIDSSLSNIQNDGHSTPLEELVYFHQNGLAMIIPNRVMVDIVSKSMIMFYHRV